MPAEQTPVNLMGSDDLNRTPYGKVLTWAVSYGRYIMIGTEIIVLLAFISRFSLDRKLTDLNDEIAQKKAILEVNLPLEDKIRRLHADLSVIKTNLPKSKQTVELLAHIQSVIPPDVTFDKFQISRGALSIDAVAGTSQGFSQFLANMQAIKRIKELEVSQVRRSQISGTSFSLRGTIDPSAPLTEE